MSEALVRYVVDVSEMINASRVLRGLDEQAASSSKTTNDAVQNNFNKTVNYVNVFESKAKTLGQSLKVAFANQNFSIAYENKLKNIIALNEKGEVSIKDLTTAIRSSLDSLGDSPGADKIRETITGIADEVDKLATQSPEQIQEFIQSVSESANQFQSLSQRLSEARINAELMREQFGETSKEFIEAQQKAGELKNEIKNLNDQVKLFSPEGKFKAVVGVFQGIAGGIATAEGAMALFGEESEDVEKILLKVNAALALTQGLKEVSKLGESFRNLLTVLGLSTAAARTNAVAQEANAVATGGATVANNALNVSLLANPYVAIIAGVVALTSAFYLLSDSEEEVLEMQRELNQISIDFDRGYYDTIFNSIKERAEKEEKASDRIIKLRQAEGASEIQLSEIRKKAFDERISSLESQYKFLREEFDVNNVRLENPQQFKPEAIEAIKKRQEEINKELSEINQDYLDEVNDQNVRAAQLEQQRLQKQIEFANRRKQAEKDLFKALTLLGIAGIQDQYEQQIEQAAFEYQEQVKIYDQQFKEQLIDQTERNSIVLALFNDFKTKRIKIKQEEADALKAINEKNKQEDFDATFNVQDQLANENIENLRTRYLQEADFSINAEKALNKAIENEKLRSLESQKKLLQDAGDSFAAIQKQINDILFKNQEESNSKAEQLIKDRYQRAFTLTQEFEKGILDLINSSKEDQIKDEENKLEFQNEINDQKLQANQDLRDKELISEQNFRATEKILLAQNVQAQKAAQKEIAELKRKEAVANKLAKIFDIGIATARNIVEAGTDFPLAVYFATLGAIQAAFVLAQPIPKFFKGVKSVPRGNNPVGIDTVPAMLTAEERVVEVEKNKKWWDVYEAIDNNTFEKYININYVAPALQKHKEQKQQTERNIFAQTIATNITNGLTFDQAKAIQKRGMRITNVDELADAFTKKSESVPLSW